MKNNLCILILALLWPSFLWGSEPKNFTLDFSTSNPLINQNEERPNTTKQLAKEIIEDAYILLNESKSLNIANIIRTIKICVAYHECVDELTSIFMPGKDETLSVFMARTIPSKTKPLVGQIIHNKANALDSLFSISSRQSTFSRPTSSSKKKNQKKNEIIADYSTLEYQNLKHIYRVWHKEGTEDAEGVIKAYLDIPFEQLSKAYTLAKKQGLLRSFFEVAFVPGCIAIKTNKLERWYSTHSGYKK